MSSWLRSRRRCGRASRPRLLESSTSFGSPAPIGYMELTVLFWNYMLKETVMCKAMTLKPEFLFDFGSPNAYLAHKVIPEIEQRTGVKFTYVPVLLGGIFKLTGNRSPLESLKGIKNKPEFFALEMQRFIRRHGIEAFKPNPFFPVITLLLMRGAVAAL